MLTTLWGDGLSAGDIAKAMNLSRNAVLGKANRLGLENRCNTALREQRMDQLAELVAEGATIVAASKLIGVTDRTATVHWKEIRTRLGWQAI